jgi:Flp pilus assembly protein TadG
MMRFLNLSRAFARREDGNSTIEFVTAVPTLMFIFMMAFESGWFMVKSTMLERSVNMTIRQLSQGHIPNPTVAELKTRICDQAVIFDNCDTSIMVELQPISQTAWNMPAQAVTCINRDEAIQPATPWDPGANHDIMLVRVCVMTYALFPSTGLGAYMVRNEDGEIGLTAVQAFVNEPFAAG